MKRKQLSKKLRFEVFKRDSFTCQYCGRKAPDVILEVDHIEPVSKGGTNDIMNLITSCRDCNSGKSNRQLTDKAIIEKRRKQLEELQLRKEQIEMMFLWQKELLTIDEDAINALADFWSELLPGYTLNERGLQRLRSLYKHFGLNEVMSAMKISVEQYIRYDSKGVPTKESVELAWGKVIGICYARKRFGGSDKLARIYYIRGILRKRLYYFDENKGLFLLKRAVKLGADLERLEQHAKEVVNWTEWRTDIEEFIESKTQEK